MLLHHARVFLLHPCVFLLHPCMLLLHLPVVLLHLAVLGLHLLIRDGTGFVLLQHASMRVEALLVPVEEGLMGIKEGLVGSQQRIVRGKPARPAGFAMLGDELLVLLGHLFVHHGERVVHGLHLIVGRGHFHVSLARPGGARGQTKHSNHHEQEKGCTHDWERFWVTGLRQANTYPSG